jgi:XTP/dITP diphosphohydrolase
VRAPDKVPTKLDFKLYLASSNPGKLREFAVLADAEIHDGAGHGGKVRHDVSVALELLPGFNSLPAFEENAPTFAENALGKALHAAPLVDGLVFADDSGLVVPALGGAPGVQSARYAGPNATSQERNQKLLRQLRGKIGDERRAYFVCAIALVEHGRPVAVVTALVDGEILEAPSGAGGFGYDPVFHFPPLQKTFAELSAAQKNEHSHRGKAFRKLLRALKSR